MPVNPPVPIPVEFLDRMKNLLGEADYPAFASSFNAAPVSGLRVNTLKLEPEKFKAIAPFALGETIPWCKSAFTLTGDERPGLHPYHMAGLYYLQDPSAMSPAGLLAPQPGERVLDLAAAPGGKTTHLAALMKGTGLLVANEIKNKRVGHLAQNVERWGAGNVVITNESPERLADHFGASFDRVLVDAPCSGEGMFRKDMGARADWSTEMVAGCAVRQKNILRVAARLVRPGGYLLYSTCTFAPEEDEGVIDQLLRDFPGFEVLPLPRFPGFTGGRPEWIEAASSLTGAVRLFPHHLSGEGHFACLLQNNGLQAPARAREAAWTGLSKQAAGLWRAFAAGLSADFPEDRLKTAGERLYYVPELTPDFGRLRIVHPGVWLGSFKKDRFEPAHPLALFLKPGQANNVYEMAPESRELAAYLRGESLSVPAGGWTVVTTGGYPIGWGKGVQGTLKNHFPRGWLLP
ncbi:MAG TPA: RsmB/NOP family class I SAM-dependent RNA methyltransferase [Anaerolineales bacterium]|jgi:NOL1/NOP2/sun family putative RNA methylase